MAEEDFGAEELAAAERTDAQVDALLAGRADDTVEAHLFVLAATVRTDPPPGLAARVEARLDRVRRRQWRPVRYVAALLGYLFVSQGLGNLVWGDWVADGVGDAFSPHTMRESGFALIAVGAAVAAGAVSRRMLPVSVAAGVPLALAFGISGVGEIGVFAAGAVLHLSQGVVGIALGLAYWRYRVATSGRYTSGPDGEEGA